MNNFDRVIWSEGLLLRPQLFQQQERFLERQFDARIDAVRPYTWGIKRLLIDAKLLQLGKVSIQEASGIFPDGTPFDIPNTQTAPTPIELPKDLRDVTVYLAVPISSAGTQLASHGQSEQMTRYGITDCEVADQNSNDFTMELIEVGELNLKLICGDQNLPGFSYLPIAKVLETQADGTLKLDKRFVPPCLTTSASTLLDNLLEGIIGITRQRADHIAKSFGERSVSTTAGVAEFLMLQMLNRYEAALNHIQQQKNLHPEIVYRELLQFASELATFTKTSKRPDPMPVYNHETPSGCFPAIAEIINRALTTVSEQRAVSLEIEEKRFGVRVVRSGDTKLFQNARCVLAVKADLTTDEILKIFPRQIKIAPIERVSEFVNNQLPGIEIIALPTAPRELPYHSGFHYFSLDATNQYWPEVAKTSALAFHIAGEYPGLVLEMWAIKGNG